MEGVSRLSASDAWGYFDTPCPDCGGKIWYASFGSDCRGNESSSTIKCEGECKRVFTTAEWTEIGKIEIAVNAVKRWKREISKSYKTPNGQEYVEGYRKNLREAEDELDRLTR